VVDLGKSKPTSLGTTLRQLGFDETAYDRTTKYYTPKCSSCQAVVVNGTACHEQGCPNARRPTDGYDD